MGRVAAATALVRPVELEVVRLLGAARLAERTLLFFHRRNSNQPPVSLAPRRADQYQERRGAKAEPKG
jgi:hypothetical protein